MSKRARLGSVPAIFYTLVFFTLFITGRNGFTCIAGIYCRNKHQGKLSYSCWPYIDIVFVHRLDLGMDESVRSIITNTSHGMSID